MSNTFFLLSFLAISFFALTDHSVVKNPDVPNTPPADSSRWIHFPHETHLQNVRQLTLGGENAEAYWSFNSQWLTFQRTDNQQYHCEQIYWGKVPQDSSSSF